jgi:hypothetical protein
MTPTDAASCAAPARLVLTCSAWFLLGDHGFVT